MDKCKREKEELYKWASTASKNYFACENNGAESYFRIRENDSYIQKYDFETLPELKNALNAIWQQDEIMQKCMKSVLIAALKMKPDEAVRDTKDTMKKCEDELPSYIYNM